MSPAPVSDPWALSALAIPRSRHAVPVPGLFGILNVRDFEEVAPVVPLGQPPRSAAGCLRARLGALFHRGVLHDLHLPPGHAASVVDARGHYEK